MGIHKITNNITNSCLLKNTDLKHIKACICKTNKTFSDKLIPSSSRSPTGGLTNGESGEQTDKTPKSFRELSDIAYNNTIFEFEIFIFV